MDKIAVNIISLFVCHLCILIIFHALLLIIPKVLISPFIWTVSAIVGRVKAKTGSHYQLTL